MVKVCSYKAGETLNRGEDKHRQTAGKNVKKFGWGGGTEDIDEYKCMSEGTVGRLGIGARKKRMGKMRSCRMVD